MKELLFFSIIIAVTIFTSCSGKRLKNIGIRENRLLPCPKTPNCVSSYETNEKQGLEPLSFTGNVKDAMKKLADVIKGFPRVEIITRNDKYLHAEFTSLLFRFVDDVEFLFDEEKKIIHLRSASRTGYSDMGVNRKRIEQVREMFMK